MTDVTNGARRWAGSRRRRADYRQDGDNGQTLRLISVPLGLVSSGDPFSAFAGLETVRPAVEESDKAQTAPR